MEKKKEKEKEKDIASWPCMNSKYSWKNTPYFMQYTLWINQKLLLFILVFQIYVLYYPPLFLIAISKEIKLSRMDLRARTSTIINIRIIQGPNKKHTLLSICWTFKNQATTNSCLLLLECSFHLSYYNSNHG